MNTITTSNKSRVRQLSVGWELLIQEAREFIDELARRSGVDHDKGVVSAVTRLDDGNQASSVHENSKTGPGGNGESSGVVKLDVVGSVVDGNVTGRHTVSLNFEFSGGKLKTATLTENGKAVFTTLIQGHPPTTTQPAA